MKIIDLLNKIANGEEVPMFKYEGHRYEYSKANEMFEDLDNDERCKSEIYFCELNDEVEIIEGEKKIPEKLQFEEGKINDNEFLAKYITHNRKAINEIIDYLKSKGE